MSQIREDLKKLRKDKGLSLAKVQEMTSITDSRLSRAEKGSDTILTPNELKILAKLYGVSVVRMYVVAGYLEDSDLEEHSSIFKNANLLDAEAVQYIQNSIDFLLKREGKKI